MAASLLLWIRVGRDKDVISVIEFYPPDGLNCGEMAYAYYGSVDNMDLVPMIIGLASKGYIKIIQNDESGKEFSFRINMEKDYQGGDKSELAFLNGLKQYGNIVKKKELENSFYKTLNKVRNQIVDDFKPKLFIKSTLVWRFITFILALIPYIVGLYAPIRFYTGEFIFGLFIPAVFWVCLTVSTLMITQKKAKIGLRIFISIVMLVPVGFLIKLIAPALIYAGSIYWVVLGACLLGNIIQMIFFRIIDKRTDYGIELYGRIKGFRNYLITAEKPHLVALVKQDPSYFYKILPYTYVLNVTDAWVDQFEGIAMEAPGWYSGYGYSAFNYHSFNSFMRSTMASTKMAMTSTPSSSGSGGGFSGGGGGGGGGGSW